MMAISENVTGIAQPHRPWQDLFLCHETSSMFPLKMLELNLKSKKLAENKMCVFTYPLTTYWAFVQTVPGIR